MKSEDGNKYRCVERTESSRKMRGARKTQTAYGTNINRAIRNPPSKLGPPYRREYIPELYTERAGK